MKTAQLLATLAALAPMTLAANARVVNRCSGNVYVRAGGGNTVTLSPNGGTWQQSISGTGNQIYIGVTPQLPAPMEFDYSVHTASGDVNNYYAISTKPNNNPFGQQGFSLIPGNGNSGCHAIHCPGRQGNDCADVYNPSGNVATWACNQANDLTVYTCQG